MGRLRAAKAMVGYAASRIAGRQEAFRSEPRESLMFNNQVHEGLATVLSRMRPLDALGSRIEHVRLHDLCHSFASHAVLAKHPSAGSLAPARPTASEHDAALCSPRLRRELSGICRPQPLCVFCIPPPDRVVGQAFYHDLESERAFVSPAIIHCFVFQRDPANRHAISFRSPRRPTSR